MNAEIKEFENVLKQTCNKVKKTFLRAGNIDKNKVTLPKARSRRKIILHGNDRHKLRKSKPFYKK